MLLKLFKKEDNHNLPKQLTEYLNKVDEAYMKSFRIKSIRDLQNYVSRDCAVKISQSVFAIGSRYFGAEKFRTTTWTLEKEDSDILTILKSVVFDKVHIGGSMKIEVANNYREIWVVDNTRKSRPVVLDITMWKEL